METSAKTGFNVGKCLMDLVRYDPVLYIPMLGLYVNTCTHTHTHTHRTIKVYYEQGGMNRTERGIQISNKPKGSSCCGR